MSSDKENKVGSVLNSCEDTIGLDRTRNSARKSCDFLLETIESLTVLPTTISEPDFEKLKQDRMDRNRAVMAKIVPRKQCSSSFLENSANSKQSDEHSAAICLQKYYRGWLGRKLYVKHLQEHFEQEEKDRLTKQKEQIEEGELLIESHKLESEITDEFVALRNRERRILYYVTVIQRAWRRYKQRQTKEKFIKPQHGAHDRFPVKEYLI